MSPDPEFITPEIPSYIKKRVFIGNVNKMEKYRIKDLP